MIPAARDESDAIKRVMPWLVAVALFMEIMDVTIVGVAVPTIARDLGVEPISLKGVLSSYTLSLALFIPVSGWMADRFGTKRVFFFAILVFLLGSLLCALSNSVPLLVASRIIQGMGGAMMTPVGRVALIRTFPRSEMIQAMNYVVIPALVAPTVGPFLGGLIVQWLPWRTIFFINLPIGIVGLVAIRRYMPDYRDPDAGPLNRVGFLLFGSGVATLAFALEVFGAHDFSGGQTALVVALGVGFLGLYGWHARRTARPLLKLSLFRIRTFRIPVLGSLITRLGISGMPFLLPLFYQVGLGFSPWQAGLLTTPQAIAAILMKLWSRRLLARFGYRAILLSNTVLIGMTIMLYQFIGPGTPIPFILGCAFLTGLFVSLHFTCLNSLVYADVADRDAGSAGSIASTVQQMALSFGVVTGSLVAGWFLTGIPQTQSPEFVEALHRSFLVLGSVTIVTSLTFVGLRSKDGSGVSRHGELGALRGRGSSRLRKR